MTEVSSAVELMQSIDIVDEISKFVKLKPNKHELLGLCPFHTEDTPSFYVNPSKQLFYCFGCQQGGNVINFRSKITGLTLKDALEALAKDYHINLKSQPQIKGYRDVLDSAVSYYKSMLQRSDIAKQYLKERHLTEEIIQLFEVGFAPKAWNNLKGLDNFPLKDALDIGLVLQGDKGSYDRFRNRIMFPIRSHQGQLVGFGGRTLGDEKPKYINSSDSHVYHKSEVLYGLYQALQQSEKHLIVVEGYMDVISLYQAGFKGAVAALGTAFTVEQFQLLSKYAEKVTFCFDGDLAGHNAAKKAFFTILPYLRDQLSCHFLILEDDDPDAFIQKYGKNAFKEKLDNAKPLSKYLLEDIVALDVKSLEDKAKYIHQVKDILNQMPHSILKRLIARQVGVLPQFVKSQPVKKEISLDLKLIALIFGYADLIRDNQALIDPILLQLPEMIQKAYQSVLSMDQKSLAVFLQENGLDTNNLNEVKIESEQKAAQEISDLLKHYQLMAVENKIRSMMSKEMDARQGQILQELLKVKHLLKKKKITLLTKEGS
jgi:DNA primase